MQTIKECITINTTALKTPITGLAFATLMLAGCGQLDNGNVKRSEANYNQHTEEYYNQRYCKKIGGKTEVRHSYRYQGGRGYVLVDCETDSLVIEGGLDKRSSLDSLQQALFFQVLTHKKPVVVIYNTDGKIGKIEHRIQQAADIVGVEFISVERKEIKAKSDK